MFQWHTFENVALLESVCGRVQQKNRTPAIKKKLTHIGVLQVPATQLANMSIDPKFVELMADVHKIILFNNHRRSIRFG